MKISNDEYGQINIDGVFLKFIDISELEKKIRNKLTIKKIYVNCDKCETISTFKIRINIKGDIILDVFPCEVCNEN